MPLILIIGVISIFLPGCLELNPLVSTETDALPDTATIRYGNVLYYPEEKLFICFADVLSDGRCPTNVDCCWEGVAEIELGLRIKSEPEITVPIQIFGYVDIENSERHVFIDTLGYRIFLMGLYSYPSEPGEYDYTKYVATISILKIIAG
ncbi:hypothetical protein KJ762_11745 [bacterium]|nr:hypothetical protein [bacterium]